MMVSVAKQHFGEDDVVHTKGKEPKSKEIIKKIKDNLENKYNIIDISYICVESMNSEINIDENNKIITHSFGLNELINITKNSISKSFICSSYFESYSSFSITCEAVDNLTSISSG